MLGVVVLVLINHVFAGLLVYSRVMLLSCLASCNCGGPIPSFSHHILPHLHWCCNGCRAMAHVVKSLEPVILNHQDFPMQYLKGYVLLLCWITYTSCLPCNKLMPDMPKR